MTDLPTNSNSDLYINLGLLKGPRLTVQDPIESFPNRVGGERKPEKPDRSSKTYNCRPTCNLDGVEPISENWDALHFNVNDLLSLVTQYQKLGHETVPMWITTDGADASDFGCHGFGDTDVEDLTEEATFDIELYSQHEVRYYENELKYKEHCIKQRADQIKAIQELADVIS